MVTEFVNVQFLMANEDESQAIESLSQFQMRVMFGQKHQVKVLSCLEGGMVDFESDEDSEDEEVVYDGSEYSSSEYAGESNNKSEDEFCEESESESEDDDEDEDDGGKSPDACKCNILTK